MTANATLLRNAHKRNGVVRPRVYDQGSTNGAIGGVLGDAIYMRFAVAADGSPAWGTAGRDLWLRKFWKQEDMLASAVASTAARYAGIKWDLTGGVRTAEVVRQKLHLSEHGKGWKALIIPTVIDSLTQENGGWMEVYREGKAWDSPWTQLNHLDSARCHRTGRWEQPIDYVDDSGAIHKMNWWQVLELTDCPDPSEDARGMQLCAVSRVLRAAQIIRDIAIYNHEKISGQFNRRVTIVNGVGKNVLNEALGENRANAVNEGLLRYIQPVILPTLDHRANLSKIDIDLAALPEGWDFDIFMRWYIVQLALAFQQDPQEFAPLPGHNLGSSQQSETLHMKERNKGPNLFMSTIEHQFNFLGIIPDNVNFIYGEQDAAVDLDKQRVSLMRAQELALLVKAGILTPEIAAQILADEGRINYKYLKVMGINDLTAQETIPRIGAVPAVTGDTSGYSKIGDAPPGSLSSDKKVVPSASQPNRIGGGTTGSTTDNPAMGIR